MTEKETRLVEENVPLAVYTAGQWMKKAVLEWEDALSAAEYGLVKAAMSFEEERGFCFSTYAVSVMENEIRMELRKRNRRKKSRVFWGSGQWGRRIDTGRHDCRYQRSFWNVGNSA